MQYAEFRVGLSDEDHVLARSRQLIDKIDMLLEMQDQIKRELHNIQYEAVKIRNLSFDLIEKKNIGE
jgi:hypothetical protein